MKPVLQVLAIAVVGLVAACASPEEKAAAYLVKAQEFYDQGDYTKARIEAQNAAQVEPKNAKARYLLALVAEQDQEFRQMFGHLTVVVDEDPGNVDARLKLGTLYFLGQAWNEAAEQADALLKLAPQDSRVHLLNARVLIQKGDRAGGMAEVDKALELDPDNVEAILLKAAGDAIENLDQGLATLDAAIARLPADKSRPLRELRVVMLSQGKRTAEVEQSLADLARDFPKEQGYQFQLAQFYASQGRVDEADKLLKGLTELDPKDVDKQLGYVQFLDSQRDEKQAEGALQGFIEKNPDSTRLKLALGQFYESKQRREEARKVYQQVADQDAKSADGLAARGRVAAIDIQLGKLDQGRAGVEAILKDAPDNPDALLLRAGLKFNDKQYNDAIADLRLVLRKTADNQRALLLLAQAYLQTNDVPLAKDTYRRLLEVNPNSPEGLQQLAALYSASREYEEAEALLRKRLATQPDDVLSSGRLVEVLLARGQNDKAEAEARRMAELANQTGVGDFSLGRVLAQKKDYAGASESFRRSLEARGGDPLPLEGLVRSLMAAEKPNEAIAVLNSQVEAGQNELFAKFLLGGVYGSQGDQQKAEAYLEDVLKEKPDAVVAWASLAGLYPNDPAKRLAVYQRGVKANPGSPELTMLLGTELEQQQRYDEAIAGYEALLKTQPGFEPALNNLAALLLDQRTDKASWARALELAKKLENSTTPAVLDTVGWAYYRNAQYPQAVSYLERVVAQAGQFPIFRYHLGMAYLAAGNPVGAKQELTQAVEKAQGDYPGLAEARSTLAKLNQS